MDIGSIFLLMALAALGAFFLGVWTVSFLVHLADREFERYFTIKKL